MIFKVSFKETPKQPSKAVTKVGLTTTVILKGVVKLPEFFDRIPANIMEWIGNQKKVEIYEDMANYTMQIFSTGMAECHEEDKYDSLLGERLAEARAKYDIYKFFYGLTSKLFDYYNKILFGDVGVVGSGDGSCLAKDVKKYEGLLIKESYHIGELLKDTENGCGNCSNESL